MKILANGHRDERKGGDKRNAAIDLSYAIELVFECVVISPKAKSAANAISQGNAIDERNGSNHLLIRPIGIKEKKVKINPAQRGHI